MFSKLSKPQKVQTFLDSFPTFVTGRGVSICGPLHAVANKRMHCVEGATVAALALALYGREPLLLDLRSKSHDHDHVVALFKEQGLWGAISKTNYPTLRWRDPVYRSVRELAMSYFHEYFLESGEKTMLDYSKPFNLTHFEPKDWVGAEDIDWLAEALDDSPHFPVAPRSILGKLRKASIIETKTMGRKEWSRSGKRLV